MIRMTSMKTCTILIPHVSDSQANSLNLLYGSIEQIQIYTNNVDWEVVIVDQSEQKIHDEILEHYYQETYSRIKIIHAPKIDCGYPIDLAARLTSREYFCSLDCDAFPIHRNWLSLPITLIEEYGFSFVGQETGLGESYRDDFFHLNNYFRVSKTKTAKLVSENAGFCQYQHRERISRLEKRYRLDYEDVGWSGEADNGVVAMWWADKVKLGDKLSFGLTRYTGETKGHGLFGFTVDDLVFHFVFGYFPMSINDPENELGKDYFETRHLIDKLGLTDEVITYLLSRLKPRPISEKTEVWNCSTKERRKLDVNDQLYKRITQLKTEKRT